MTAEPEFINDIRKDIWEEMQSMVKDFLSKDFIVSVEARRYMWDSEKKEFIDLRKKSEE